MKIITTVEAGYFRGDLSAARYLATGILIEWNLSGPVPANTPNR